MINALSNSKLSSPSKFVRRVLSRASTASRSSHEDVNSKKHTKSHTKASTSEAMKIKQDMESLEVEITSLREQVSMLQLSIGNMQEDAEKREKTLESLAKEKQQLAIDLKRERRSTTNLKQQLSDEREFYYKEKEQYCQEMNDCKKLKKKMSKSSKKEESPNNNINNEEGLESFGIQITKLKEMLNQALEANYNLSIKFLRMKNTKISLKNRLKKQMNDHDQAMKHIQTTIDDIKKQIADIIDKKFQLPISPSNKKFLQIVKQNGTLLHENLCLQMEVDRLNSELCDLQYIGERNETRKQLKYYRESQPEKNEEKPGSSKQVMWKKESKSRSVKQTSNDEQTKSRKSLTTRKSSEERPRSRRSLTSRKSSDVQSESKKDSTTRKSSMTKNNPEKVNSSDQEKKKTILKTNTKDSEVIKIYERNEIQGIPHIIMLSESREQHLSPEQKPNNRRIDNDVSELEANNLPRECRHELHLMLPPLSKESSLVSTELSEPIPTASNATIRTRSAPSIVQNSSFVSKLKH